MPSLHPEPGAPRRLRAAIKRDPLPAPIPRGPLAERLAVIEEINWKVAVDAFVTFDMLQAAGWGAEALGDAAQGYRQWWHDQIDTSIDTATALWVVSS